MLKYSLPFCVPDFWRSRERRANAARRNVNGPGRYEIENVESGLLLDVAAEEPPDRTAISRRGRLNQLWDIQPAANGYFTLQSADQEKLLSLKDAPLARGRWHRGFAARRRRKTNSGRSSPLAPGEFHDRFEIRRRAGCCRHRSHEKGTRLQIWTRTGDENQRFRLFCQQRRGHPGTRNYRGGPSSRRTTWIPTMRLRHAEPK